MTPTADLTAPVTEVVTTFSVPLLRENSVACGGCCPVPAEAVIVPEVELLPGVVEAEATWQIGEVRVRHAASLDPAAIAEALAEVRYPAESWHTQAAPDGQ